MFRLFKRMLIRLFCTIGSFAESLVFDTNVSIKCVTLNN